MAEFIVAGSIILVIVGMLFALVAYEVSLHKRGGWSRLINYFKHGAGKGAITGVRAVVFIALVAALLLFFPSANATQGYRYYDIRFLDHQYFRAGVDFSKQPVSPQCRPGGASDRATSTVEIGTSIIRYGRVSSYAYFQHKSCAVNRDRFSYDAIGFDLRIDF